MKKSFLLFVVLSLLFVTPSVYYNLHSEEVMMEEGDEGNVATNESFEEGTATKEEATTLDKKEFSGKNTATTGNSVSEESFTEEDNTQMEEPDDEPANPTEKELKNIPPANRVEEEFQEESSDNYLVTDEELQNLEEKINNLRNQILDTKSKIMELGDRLSQGFISGTKLKIVIDNKLKGSFVPVKMVVKIDGYPVYKNDKEDQLISASGLEAFSASVLPENHRIDVEMIVKGKGFGIFTYMEAVKMLVRTTYYLNAPRGKEIVLHIIPYDKGSFYKLKDRPQLKFEVR